jgi:preprotein translocase subunit SecF
VFNIIGRRNVFFLVSALLIIPGVIALLLWGLRLGVDFTGGSLLEVRLTQNPLPAAVRDVFAANGHGDAAVVTSTDSNGRTSYIVRTRSIETPEKNALVAQLGERFGTVTEDRFETVGPAVSLETTQNAFKATGLASLAILGYLTFAFRQVPKPWRYGTCAVVALLHDALLVLGLWAILGHFFGFEVDSLFVTAVLTVIGFSVHDTIVVFDRIRENVHRFPGESFERIANFSVNQTLDRSINTGLATVFTLTALLLIGGATIRNFVLVLLIGIISGTYSSIFNATCLLVVWENGNFPRLRRSSGGTRPGDVAAMPAIA